MTSCNPDFERRVRAVLALAPASARTSGREARIRAVLAEADAAPPREWPEPEGGFGLAADLPCLAAAIRGTP